MQACQTVHKLAHALLCELQPLSRTIFFDGKDSECPAGSGAHLPFDILVVQVFEHLARLAAALRHCEAELDILASSLQGFSQQLHLQAGRITLCIAYRLD